MVIDKVVDLYQKACGLGLSVSLSIHHLNGQESFSLFIISNLCLAGRLEC